MAWFKDNWRKVVKFVIKALVMILVWKVLADMLNRGDTNFFVGIGLIALIALSSIFLFGWKKETDEEEEEGPDSLF